MKSKRINIPAIKPYANSNIYLQYLIQNADWITHPDIDQKNDNFFRFYLDFNLNKNTTLIFHISGDQRFEFFCDNSYIGMGPDRSDLNKWSFHTYEINLDSGKHRLGINLYHLVSSIPRAQISHYPAIIVSNENYDDLDLRTGHADWKCYKINSISCKPVTNINHYMAVGGEYTIDVNKGNGPKMEAVIYNERYTDDASGQLWDHWRLFPTRIEEQIRKPISSVGSIRSIMNENNSPIVESKAQNWDSLLNGSTISIPKNTTYSVIWDLENYYCAYPVISTKKGKGSIIKLSWAESCYEEYDNGKGHKGNRNKIEGKYFIGFGDTFITNGDDIEFTTPWYRTGRYIQIEIETREEALFITNLYLNESRYPCECQSSFTSNDTTLDNIQSIATRGIQMCSHETYMDCPYYEQMMYVGDTRLQMLTHYTMEHRPELNLRGIELFDWSRSITNFVLERHPSNPRQLSTTFSMIWIMMLRDQAWWQNNVEFLKDRLPGMRSLLEEFRSLSDSDMILSNLPGWSFVDWVDDKNWEMGYAPDGQYGFSSINNLLFLNALKSAIDIEKYIGDEYLAQSYEKWAQKLSNSIRSKFWDHKKQLFSDTLSKNCYSEHAQCLAILSGYFTDLEEDCFKSLIHSNELAKTTVYFSFYLFDTYQKMKRTDLLIGKLQFWKELISQGFKTPVEMPEPSRSDCHAWGSHPLYHFHASIMGIRPASPGFSLVEIAPQPGSLTKLKAKTPHPLGWITTSLDLTKEKTTISIQLPKGLKGTLIWKNKKYTLVNGLQEFTL